MCRGATTVQKLGDLLECVSGGIANAEGAKLRLPKARSP